MTQYQTSFPAVRGYQAGRAYYVTMCPLELVSSLFVFDMEDESDPMARAQRKLNKARIPELADYMIANPTDYVFSALTASVDGEIKFTAGTPETPDAGLVTLPTSTHFVINDGQHRRAAIEEALKQRPELRNETIAVVLFVDRGLRRSQQMFADLNKNAVRPTKSLGILYDHRDQLSQLARQLMVEVPIFQRLTETEKSTISNRSSKLFTLSTIYFSTRLLLKKRPRSAVSIEEQAQAKAFWIEVCKNMSDWQDLAKSKANKEYPRRVTAAELRTDYVHAHGVAAQAIAMAGAGLQEQDTAHWRKKLQGLARIDWHRSNQKLWEGRAMVGGRMTNSQNNVTLTANVIKKTLGIALTQEESKLEDNYAHGQS